MRVPLMVAATASGVAMVTRALVAYYKLDEGSGLTANDSGTGNRDGTLANGAAFNATGVALDGVNDYVSTTAPTAAGMSLSWCAVVTRTNSTNAHTLLGTDGASANALLRADAAGTGAQFWSDTGFETLAVPGGGALGPVFVAVTFDGGTREARGYVNGALAGAAATLSNAVKATAGNLKLGAWAVESQGLLGTHHFASFHDAVLTAAEIESVYDYVKSIKPTLGLP